MRTIEYIFYRVGVECEYYSILSNNMVPLASKNFIEADEDSSPYKVDVHFENGLLVTRCSQNMQIPDKEFGGSVPGFTGTVLTDGRDRILETDVKLPWDMTVDKDFTISNGNLDLNRHTLTIEGDLIQSGGTLTVNNGTLNIHGNYRLQSSGSNGYGDSSGALRMNNSKGTINIDGDFILQTTSTKHSVSRELLI